jgi:chromosome partitioning protein
MSKQQDIEDLNAVIRQHSEWLSSQRENLFPPNALKQRRTFTSGEAAGPLGVNDSNLR